MPGLCSGGGHLGARWRGVDAGVSLSPVSSRVVLSILPRGRPCSALANQLPLATGAKCDDNHHAAARGGRHR